MRNARCRCRGPLRRRQGPRAPRTMPVPLLGSTVPATLSPSALIRICSMASWSDMLAPSDKAPPRGTMTRQPPRPAA